MAMVTLAGFRNDFESQGWPSASMILQYDE
jgi:hypothetical protein